MLINPFKVPKNYSEMLDKIGWFTFLNLLIIFSIIDDKTSFFSSALKPLFSNMTSLNYITDDYAPIIITAALLGLIFRMIKLHDLLSDLFKIREDFDTNNILRPLVEKSNINNVENLTNRLIENRQNLMSTCFYKYASFIDPKIEKQLVSNSVENWHWFWVLIESVFIWYILAYTLLIYSVIFTQANYSTIFLILVSLGAIGFFLLSLLYKRCKQNAIYQIDSILSDTSRKNEVQIAINNAL